MSIEVGALGSSSRVEAYSDAVFSIVSTVMILPVTHTSIPDNVPLPDFLWSKAPLLIVYVYSFYLVSSVWNIHVMLFDTIEKSSETLVLINLCLMMSTTFLPFTFYLTGEFPEDFYAILLYCSCTMFVMFFMAFMIFYSFKVPGIQPIDFVINPNRLKRRNMMYMHIAVPLVLCLLAILIAFVSPGLAASIFLSCIVFNVLIVKGLTKLIDVMFKHKTNMVGERIPALYEPKHVSKDRVECFSDGVFAIVATLLILDLCEDVTKEEGTDVLTMLTGMSNMILAYFGSFVTIALLWFVHHSTLHCMKEFSRVMGFFNTLCLACIGFFPFTFKIMNEFNDHPYGDNETVAIQLTAAAVFIASISQAIIWVIALYNPQRYLDVEASYGGSHHVYTTAKLAIFPLFSLTVFFVTFKETQFTTDQVYGMQLAAPVIFIALRVIDLAVANIKKRRAAKNTGTVVVDSMLPCDNLGLNYGDEDITM